MNPHDTIVAISSAPGPAPRGIVRIAGPAALPCVAALGASRQPMVATALHNREPGAYEAVELLLPDWPAISALLLVFVAPHSYSGDDLVELHLPGAPVLLEAVVAELLRRTARNGGTTAVRHAEPGEFTLRALLNGRLDVTQAEAVSQVIGAREPEAAVRHLAQLTAGRLDGAPSHSLAGLAAGWRERLGTLMARAELALDFSEDEDFWHVADPPRLKRELSELVQEIRCTATQRRTRRAERGDVPEVVLLGPANAGKSSLLNALAGGRRAIVTRIPGTTRDAVSHVLELPGGPRVRLWDTAGLREAAGWQTTTGATRESETTAEGNTAAQGDEQARRGGGNDSSPNSSHDALALDAAAEAMSLDLVREADVLVWCWPADDASLELPRALLETRGTDWLLNQTKADLPAAWSLSEAAARFGNRAVVSTSARNPESLGALGRAVGEALTAHRAAHAEHGGGGLLANARQAAHLEAAVQHLEQAQPLAEQAETMELASHEMAAAEAELAQLLGEDPVSGVASEALLTRIFSTFCLGK